MSGEGEKSFEPTPGRIAKAKRDGNVVRSQEFGANVSFIAASVATAVAAVHIAAPAEAALRSASLGRAPIVDSALIVGWSLVPLGAAAVFGSVGSLMQSGGLHFSGLGLKVERLSPFDGIKRMLSREAAFHGFRAIAAVSIVIPAIVPAVRNLFAVSVRSTAPAALADATWSATVRVIATIAALGTAFGLVEFAIARREWRKKLRMSLEEFKRELRENDGDPAVRARRKAVHRSLVRSAITRVKEAAFVVVNPTHVAIAIDYRPPAIPVPVVLVRAADELALRVRDLARAHGIPIVENVSLARALYADTHAGLPIPLEHYVAVAEVVSSLLRAGALT
jgi:flagellar biosynthesis protein FlhB